MKQDLILIGGGGHCKSCIDVIESHGKFKISGIVDVAEKSNQKVLGYEIIGSDEDLPELVKKHRNVLITIGSIKDPQRRIEKFEYLKKLNACFPVIISALAHVSKSVQIGEGTVIMHRAVINPGAVIGKNCIINSCALIEHDAAVGDHAHLSTGSIVNGYCSVGSRVFMGSNSVMINGTKVADDVVVGAGCVVTRSIAQPGTYVGNPARKVNC